MNAALPLRDPACAIMVNWPALAQWVQSILFAASMHLHQPAEPMQPLFRGLHLLADGAQSHDRGSEGAQTAARMLALDPSLMQ